MNLTTVPKLKRRDKKRVGRGLGSGKGKTSARGTKGQKARGKIPAANVGGGLILYKKLPFRRGWGNRKVTPKPVLLTLDQLNILKPNSTVDIDTLVKSGLISLEEISLRGVKLLSKGELKVALTVKIPVSENAKQSIMKAGGTVE